MEAQLSLIMIQFLQWVADRPRCREDVLEAWRSSCPRFPVWEDARAEGKPLAEAELLAEARGIELTSRHRGSLSRRNRNVFGSAERIGERLEGTGDIFLDPRECLLRASLRNEAAR